MKCKSGLCLRLRFMGICFSIEEQEQLQHQQQQQQHLYQRQQQQQLQFLNTSQGTFFKSN